MFNRNSFSRYFVSTMLAAVLLSCNEFKEPKVGEVWRWTVKGENKNPFSSGYKLKPYYDFKVLAVQNGYVQYLDLRDSSVESSTIQMFKVSAECLSDCR
ncbi:hypothetical protein [Paracnuella aquatica]|uniref:hypothetical protein n=1 Tax=Paracnuella aquatica TaxID=2268757 RepID=UPI000F4E7A9F|nr:hypothetical protein [Paracnuella aquatica]RPD43413.1 hypothetical protein DRJ53_20280 [Paracnuella aquatica]